MKVGIYTVLQQYLHGQVFLTTYIFIFSMYIKQFEIIYAFRTSRSGVASQSYDNTLSCPGKHELSTRIRSGMVEASLFYGISPY